MLLSVVVSFVAFHCLSHFIFLKPYYRTEFPAVVKIAKTLPPEQNKYATEAALESSSPLMFPSAQSLSVEDCLLPIHYMPVLPLGLLENLREFSQIPQEVLLDGQVPSFM